MSDLGVLWVQGAGRSKENFTTAALYLATRHDSRPLLHALDGLAWPAAGPLSPVDLVHVHLQQSHSWKTDYGPERIEDAQLDLVAVGTRRGEPAWEVWIEVKVDALESGNQLEKYERYWLAERPGQPLRLVLLSPGPIEARRTRWGTGDIPVAPVRWTAVVGAISAAYDTPLDRSWHDLVDFLDEEWIAHGPVVDDPAEGADAILQVLREVNAQMRRRHKDEGTTWWANAKGMRKHVEAQRRSGFGFTTTGSNLVYGLRMHGDRWAWVVGADRRLSTKHGGLSDADLARRAGSLALDWRRPATGRLLAERTRPHHDLVASREAVDWLINSVAQLRSVGLVLPSSGSATAPPDGDAVV